MESDSKILPLVALLAFVGCNSSHPEHGSASKAVFYANQNSQEPEKETMAEVLDPMSQTTPLV